MGSPLPASAFCSICGKEIFGALETHKCVECGRNMCAFCVKKRGGFLGLLGGTEYCPYCFK